jgi:hypothetical protein
MKMYIFHRRIRIPQRCDTAESNSTTLLAQHNQNSGM